MGKKRTLPSSSGGSDYLNNNLKNIRKRKCLNSKYIVCVLIELNI